MKTTPAARKTPWRFVRVPRNLTDDWLPDLSRSELLCYLMIARRTNDADHDRAPISIREFAKTLRITARTAHRAVRGLLTKNLIAATIIPCKITVFELSTQRRTDFELLPHQGYSLPEIPTFIPQHPRPTVAHKGIQTVAHKGIHNTIEETSANGK